MSKRLKLPQSPTLGYCFVFGPNHWAEIESEKVYGREVPGKVRELLSLATLYLTLTLPEEQSAPPISSKNKKRRTVLTRIEELRTMAERLRAELFSPHHWLANYKPEGYYLDSLDRRLRLELAELEAEVDEGPHSKVGAFPLLRVSLGAVIESCDEALKMVRQGSHIVRDGKSWTTWIVLLTWIMKSYNLDWGADRETPRKGEDKVTPQAFVRLVRYLHDHVLEGDYRTDLALGKAISRARSSVKIPMVSGDDLEQLIYGMLATTRTGRGKLADLDCVLQMIRQGHPVGRHPVVPEPYFYDENVPLPVLDVLN